MGNGEDFLMRPVLAGVLPYIDLLGTKLTLYDVALLNDALDVKNENEARVWEAAKNGGGSR